MAGALAGEVALITGSSRGLGLAIALRLHAEGARIVFNYIDEKQSEYLHEIGAETGGSATQADVTNAGEVQDMFNYAEINHGQPVSIVVNNALARFSFNGDDRTPLEDLSWEEFDSQLRVAIQGTLNTTQAALPGFEQLGRGCIINIGSNLVQNPVVPYHDYTAAKGALLALTRTLAAELGPKNITVNMVTPGLLQTTEASAATPDHVFEQVEAATPLRRCTTPDDVAGVVAFFASPWARQVTGQQLCVDGGLVMN